MTYSASVYHMDGKVGASLSYSNNKGFGAAVSFDGKDCAVSAGYSHKFSDCKATIKGFVGTCRQGMEDYYNRNNMVTFGVTGNITM